VGPLLGIYILMDADRLRDVFIRVMPKKYRKDISNTMDRVNNVAGRYIRGQLLISLIVGILCTVVLLILRVDFAILLGAIAGILNIIPLLGPIIGGIPAALAALFISPLKAILVILLFIAVQQIDNYVITPNVMRYQVRVHPGLIIFSLIAGGALFGFWGLLIAVPTVAILQETLRYYLLDKNKPTSR
jgi:predicted PurR-regulated permease PerM